MLLNKELCPLGGRGGRVLSLHFSLSAIGKDLKESNKLAIDFTDAVT
jgi:hypothetical protein